MLQGVTSNLLTQGIGVATGLQSSFNWAGVAAAGVMAGVSDAVGGAIGYDPNLPLSNLQNDLLGGVAGMAGVIAGAGARTLVEGSDFGDNIMAMLPDAIGQTIGNMIAGALSGPITSDTQDQPQAGEDGGQVGSGDGGEGTHFTDQVAYNDGGIGGDAPSFLASMAALADRFPGGAELQLVSDAELNLDEVWAAAEKYIRNYKKTVDTGVASSLSLEPTGGSAQFWPLVRLDSIPIKPGKDVLPLFDKSIAGNVEGFFSFLDAVGIPAMLTDAYRTEQIQRQLTGNSFGGATAGNSLHEAGFAFDINWKDLNRLQQAQVLAIADIFGLKWGGSFGTYDPVHFFVDPFKSIVQRQQYIHFMHGMNFVVLSPPVVPAKPQLNSPVVPKPPSKTGN